MTGPRSDTVTPPPSGGATTATRPGPSLAPGAVAAIHHKTQAFDELERRHGHPVNQAGEHERLTHALQLIDSVTRALIHGDPYTERLTALAAHCARWLDYLDARAPERPTTPPRRAPRPELVRAVMRDSETPR